jgi:hypothetical protein
MCEPVGISDSQSILVPWMMTAVIPLGISSGFAGAAEALGDAAGVVGAAAAGVAGAAVRVGGGGAAVTGATAAVADVAATVAGVAAAVGGVVDTHPTTTDATARMMKSSILLICPPRTISETAH